MTLLSHLFPIVVAVLLWLVPEREIEVEPKAAKVVARANKHDEDRTVQTDALCCALAIVIGEASRHAVVVFFMDDVLQAGDRIGRTFIFYYMMGVAAIPLWQYLAKKVGKHRSLAIAMTWSGLMVLATAFLGAGDYNTFLDFLRVKGCQLRSVCVFAACDSCGRG